MPVYHCVHCDAPLTFAELDAGTCPSCRRPLDDLGRGGRPQRRRADISYAAGLALSAGSLLGWATVRAGLLLIGVGAVVALAGHLLIQVIALSAVDAPFGRADAFLLSLMNLLAVLQTGGLTAVVLGSWLCCATPGEAGARGWAIAAVGMQVAVGLTLFLIAMLSAPMLGMRVDPDIFRGPREVHVMNYLVYFLLVLAVALYAGFLTSAAGYFRARGLRTGLFVFLGISLLTNLIFLVLFILQGQRVLATLHQTLFWIRLAFYTPLVIWFIVQVFLLRGVLTETISRSWSED